MISSECLRSTERTSACQDPCAGISVIEVVSQSLVIVILSVLLNGVYSYLAH